MKATITNNSRALQGVHSVDGLVFIDAGQSKPVDVSDDYVERVKALPFFSSVWDEAPAAKTPAQPKAAPAAKPAAAAPSELSALRKEYKDAFGKGPSPKWDADTIKAKLAEKSKSFDDMSDTELKTFLGEKGVATTDETREQLVELAKAA